jgi:hypothetical protein
MEQPNFDLKIQPDSSDPAPSRGPASRYLRIGLILLLLVGALGGAGVALFTLAPALPFPGIPGTGGSSTHFRATPTRLTPAACQGGVLTGQWYCQVTLTNEDTAHALNWRVISSDSSITFEPSAAGFIDAGDAWPVTAVIPTSPCPLSATLTFSDRATVVTVGWTCT